MIALALPLHRELMSFIVVFSFSFPQGEQRPKGDLLNFEVNELFIWSAVHVV